MILWRWLRVLAGLLAVSIFVGLPYPGAFAADDDDEILLKRSSVGSLLSNRNKAEGARVAAPSDPPPAVTPAEPAREPEAQAAPAGKRGEGGPIRLFGTLEMRSKIGKMPKWTSVLEKERKNPGYVANRQFPGQGAWKDIKAKLSGMSPLEQVKAVNVLINRWPYRTDMDVWGVMDYWETPVEFFQKSGDCEDFAIAKYFALRDLGFPASQMRIVVLKDTLRNLDHAVTAVYLDGGIGQVRKLIHRLVLDQEQEKTAAGRDYKTALQELVQRENGQVLSYRLTGESGPDHAKVFAMEVLLNDGVIGSGQGRSKKEAEQAAAKAAVLTLEGEAP